MVQAIWCDSDITKAVNETLFVKNQYPLYQIYVTLGF